MLCAVCCRLSTFGLEYNRANGCGKCLSIECNVYKGRDPADAALHSYLSFYMRGKSLTRRGFAQLCFRSNAP